MVQTTMVESDAELLRAQADLWRHSLCYLTSMALRCAIKLGIPAAIHRCGGAARLPDLLAELSVPPSKLPFLRRIMRLLVTSGVFAADDTTASAVYRLTQVSRLLVDGTVADSEVVDGHTSQACFVLAATANFNIQGAQGLADWLKTEAVVPPVSPFASAHGVAVFDETRLDPEFNRMFNEGMAASSRFGIVTVLHECRGLFEGLRSLTDCGGGDGTTARAIAKTFPHIKCTVLDLPQVINTIPADGVVKYVAGDMFKSVPPAQAILLKQVLHDWSDEQCVMALANCKKAIPSRELGGKVIVIDVVVGSSSGPMYEAALLMDMGMMCVTTGHEREEHEMRKIFMDAGFCDYKINKALGVLCVIEVYP